jgi:hypothetical protein
MNKPKFVTPKFIDCAVRFIVYFLAIAITPFLARPFAPLFDWAGYGLMRDMFIEVFIVIFWGIEWLIIFKAKKLKEFFLHTGKKMKKVYLSLKGKELVEEKTEVTECEETKLVEKKEKTRIQVRPPIPMKNVVILTVLSVVCIFIMSVVTGFTVKPVYDIGEKVTGYEMYNKIGLLCRNVLKCFWVYGIIKAARGMADEIVDNIEAPTNAARYLLHIGFLLIFALFDVFVAPVIYPGAKMKLAMALTYLLFYVVFVPVYALTEGSDVKAFLLTLLIYFF